MSGPSVPIEARVSPFAQRPVAVGAMLFFVMLGVRWLFEQLQAAWFNPGTREDLAVTLFVSLAGSVAGVLFVRQSVR